VLFRSSFNINNIENDSIALAATTNGIGLGGKISVDNSTSGSHGLDVTTNGLGDACNFQVTNTNNDNSGIFIGDAGQGNGVLSYMNGTGRAGYFQINKSTNSSAALEATTNGTGPAFKSTATIAADFDGKVGINKSNPGVALDVVGSICYTGTSSLCSDIRYKKDVRPLQSALTAVERLRPVRFNWKRAEYPEEKFSDKGQIGLIAQQVKDIVPEVISQGSDGYYRVGYGRLTPVLVQAIKEQRKEIEDLKARLAVLEASGKTHK
jgi:hypothetical protein